MKINLRKVSGGTFVAADDHEEERCKRFRNNEIYQVDIKLHRNPQFHSKMFAFFDFCFSHWEAQKHLEFLDESGQREHFRKDLTILAGFFNAYYSIDGQMRLEAKSISYAAMDQEEFEQCYRAIVSAAAKNIFKDCSPETEQRLLSFF